MTYHLPHKLSSRELQMVKKASRPMTRISTSITPQDAKREAIDRVQENANREWLELAIEAGFTAAEGLREFTTDDIWKFIAHENREKIIPVETHDPRAMGAVMRMLARLKIIRATNKMKKSQRRECHHRPLQVWESLLCG